MEAVDDIDLVLGGHEHENWMLRRGRRFTPIIKADANVRSVAVVDADVRSRRRPAVGLGHGSRPSTIGSRPIPAVDAVARKWRTAAFDAFRKEGFTPEAAVVVDSGAARRP